MKNKIVALGSRLLVLSAGLRLVGYIYFNFSWQWENSLVRVLDIIVGIGFLSLWFVYGYKKKLSFKNGLVVGLIGASDGILLQFISLWSYLRSSGYYFGPVVMIPWIAPYLGILDHIRVLPSYVIICLPLLSVLMVGVGGAVARLISTSDN